MMSTSCNIHKHTQNLPDHLIKNFGKVNMINLPSLDTERVRLRAFGISTIIKNFFKYFSTIVSNSIKKLTCFPDIDTEISHSRTMAQKWTQKCAVVVISCPDNYLLFKKHVLDAASPGSSQPWNKVLFL